MLLLVLSVLLAFTSVPSYIDLLIQYNANNKKIIENDKKIDELKSDLDFLTKELECVILINERIRNAKLIKPTHISKSRITLSSKATITAYTSSIAECGKDDRITSNNTIAIPWLTAAVGHDLKKYIGTHYVYIKRLDRAFEINDSKDKKLKGVDICVNTTKEAFDIGRFKSDIVLIKK